ncbi:hypothetical protein LOTGIDRAFT_139773, partial [Lottia gigantea]
VQGTNDSSIISKASMVTQGYFEDPFYEYFVNKQLRRAPLINRGYFIRVRTVDHVIQNFLQRFPGRKQIISIGAGFDTSYFRLKSKQLLRDTVFVEIDFPELVKRKHNLISYHKELNELLSENVVSNEKSPLLELNTVDYKLLGVDLTQLNILDAALLMCGVDFELPTLILSECVLTYMTRRCSTSVVGWGSETFSNSIFVLYEQIHPNDAFGLFMQNHFHMVGSPLKCINSYPTIDSQKQRFLKQGWKWCESYNMNQFYYKLLTEEERQKVEKLEPFDEHEEWHVKCSHYMILIAYSTSDIHSIMVPDPGSLGKPMCLGDAIPNKISMTRVELGDHTIKRYSHISGYLGNKHILIFGGFGEQDGRHQRLTEIYVYDVENNKICPKQLKMYNTDCKLYPRMHLDAVTLTNGSIVIVGGRNSPYKVSKGVLVVSLASDDMDSQADNPIHIENESGSIPEPRWRHAICSVIIKGTEYVYLYGGRTMLNLCLRDSYLLNTKTGHWKQLSFKGVTPGSVQSHTLTVWKDQIVLYGGLDALIQPLCSVYILNIETWSWNQLDITGTLYPRYSHTSHVIGDKLIVTGGVNLSHNPPGIGVINLQTGQSQEFKLPEMEKEKMILFHQHSSVLLSESRLMVIGGGGNCFSFGTHLNITPFIIGLKPILEEQQFPTE